MLRAGLFGTTSAWPSERGMMSMKTKVSASSQTKLQGSSLRRIFAKMLFGSYAGCPRASSTGYELEPFWPHSRMAVKGRGNGVVEKVSFCGQGLQRENGAPLCGGPRVLIAYYMRSCQAFTWRSASSLEIPLALLNFTGKLARVSLNAG